MQFSPFVWFSCACLHSEEPAESIQLQAVLFLDHMIWQLHLITQNPLLNLESSRGSDHCPQCMVHIFISMAFWRLQSLSRAGQFAVAWWRPKHTHTATHTPAYTFLPRIQTHSCAFTHLLCPPHEELKIDDSTKRDDNRKGTGEREEEGSQKKQSPSKSEEEVEQAENNIEVYIKKIQKREYSCEMRKEELPGWVQVSPVTCETKASS